ncbi:MAG: GntR family transcriptional regulator [Oscillatoriales cyanobacterium C42_A2020_001]|nr:GntR family transcriptional regulator [Leptolyngbyaceae cyanobacterium C42_A2020_001]
MSQIPRSLQRQQPLKEQAYPVLRVAILSGELTPGQRLVESQIAKDLQVSRTPVREALRLLQHEELVSVDADNVLQVTTFSEKDAAEFYDCRIALEQLSVMGACRNLTDLQQQELQRIMQQAEKLSVGKSSQLLNFQLLDLDYRFHRLIAEGSQNLQLRSILDHLFDKMMLLRIQTIQQNRSVLNICTEHQQIYDAIAQRDSEAAIESIKSHLIASKERVVREMTQNLAKTTDSPGS